MPILLVAEHDNKSLKDATAKALSAAKAIGPEVHVLVAGKDCRPAAEAAAKLAGVAKVLVAEGAPYEHMLAEPMAALIVALALGYDTIIAPATANAKNFMPRVAALLDVMQVSDIVKVIAPDTFERLIYAGNAVQTVRTKDAKKVITVRTSTFQATGDGGAAAAETIMPPADPGLSSFVGEELSKTRPPLPPRRAWPQPRPPGGNPCRRREYGPRGPSPRNAKNPSMLSSERSLPPKPIARQRSRSVTTIRQVWPFRIEIYQ